MKIGIDFDGVVADCGKLKSDAAKRLYGLEIPPEKFKKEILIGEGLLNEEQYRGLQTVIYGTREAGLLMELVPGALEHIPALRAQGHTVESVTSRGERELMIATEWCGLQGLALDFTGVGYGVSKAGACEGFDVFIDDDLDKLEPLVGIVPHLFLMSWGYNAHIDEGSIAIRVNSWDEFAHHIRRIASL